MSNKTRSWPIEAFPVAEILNPIVESFLGSEEDRAFDWSRSAIRQLFDRADELGAPPPKNARLALIRDRLGLAICDSGISDSQPMQMLGNTASPLIEPLTSSAPVLLSRITSI